MFDMTQFRDVYLEAAGHQIRIMEAEILRLAPSGTNEAAIQRLFRAVHTLKGSSAALGLNRTRNLTHEMENVLDRIRSGQLQVTNHLITLLLIGLDRLKLLTDEFAGVCEPGGVDVESFVEALRRFAERPRAEPSVPRFGAAAAESGLVPNESPAGEEADSAVIGKARAQTIRVGVERLDELRNLVGELVNEQTRIRRAHETLKQTYRTDASVEALGQVNDHLTRVIGELQEHVMKLRLLPVEHVFARFPRMVRDLGETLGKRVRLRIEGGDTELDRTLIDEIGDPLIQLIRNALDHGIETPGERRRKGKDPAGTLRIRAFQEANRVTVLIEDDGAGIDPEKIRQAAAAKGLISEAEAAGLSDSDAVKLIFEPGLSTAEAISAVSGRGVGMDIVQNQIQSLNGTIEIDTAVDRGTTFRIKLPPSPGVITG